MSNTPIQVSYSLEEILTRIEKKLDDFRQETHQQFQETNKKVDELQKDVTVLKVNMAEVKTEVNSFKEDIKEIKGSQKAQIWTLIGVLSTTVIGAIIRFVITALPGSNP